MSKCLPCWWLQPWNKISKISAWISVRTSLVNLSAQLMVERTVKSWSTYISVGMQYIFFKRKKWTDTCVILNDWWIYYCIEKTMSLLKITELYCHNICFFFELSSWFILLFSSGLFCCSVFSGGAFFFLFFFFRWKIFSWLKYTLYFVCKRNLENQARRPWALYDIFS